MNESTSLFCVKWKDLNSIYVTSNDTTSTQRSCLRKYCLKSDWQSTVSRKLLNEAHSIFIRLQETSESEPLSPEILRKTSLQYRAVIQSCVLKIKDKLVDERNKEFQEKLQAELDYFSIMEMIWHLCEVLWIETASGRYCLDQLVTWIRWHFNDPEQLGQTVMSSDDPYSHPDYWSTVYGFTLQGRLEEVCDLLKHHPYRETIDVFASIEELLAGMPKFHVANGQSANDFQFKWNAWRKECKSQIQSSDFSDYPELEDLLEIVCGDDKALMKTSRLCQSWYQMMVAKLLYSDPCVKTHNLKLHAVECMESFNGVGKVTILDEIFLSIMSFDVHMVIEKCSENLPTSWFPTHLTDLLYHSGQLKSFHLDYGADLREFLLLEFSASLMSHPSLWVIAADYLMHCPETGRQHLETYIEKIPLESEKKALKVLRICDKYGFADQKLTICKNMGMAAVRRNRLGVALSWCLRAKDESFAAFLTEKFLDHYIEKRKFIQCDLIENLGSSMLLNNKLTFLGKYYEFHKLYMAEKFHEAGSLLVSLLTSNLAPKRFWMILLVDALPLLEYKEVIFSSEQTFDLMQCMKELELCYKPLNQKKIEIKNKAIDEDEHNQMQLLNLALTKNLSRSLLVPAT